MEEKHLEVLKRLGFETSGKTYQEVVGELIEQHIQMVNYPPLKSVGLEENLNEE